MNQYKEIINGMRTVFNSGRTRNLDWRKQQLRAIISICDQSRDEIIEALKTDLKKAKSESIGMEILQVRNEAMMHLNNLGKWSKPENIPKTIDIIMDKAFVNRDPLGVVLILGAWNFPIQLTLVPLVGAIAAGNCVILKPSEVAMATSKLLAHLCQKYLDNDCIRVIEGGVTETTALLEEKFDKIFYTGSTSVGRSVAIAAAKHLTPIVLELGGKSPCYVCSSSDLRVAARRIVWGRYVNCGQICIAPDYILCSSDIQDKLIDNLKLAIVEFYGDDPKNSDSYGRIINKRHFDRIKRLLDDVPKEKIAHGGDFDASLCYIAPTIIKNAIESNLCMTEEIFGPLLPIHPIDDYKKAIDFVNSRDKPLSLYVFTKKNDVKNNFIGNTSSGMVCINDTVIQGGVTDLPFGGVGNSGTGNYHGKYTFEAFTHYKGVLVKSQTMEKINTIRYPPYSERKLNILEKVLTKGGSSMKFGLLIPLMIFGTIIAFIMKVCPGFIRNNSYLNNILSTLRLI